MIQRIQSLFLLGASLSGALFAFLPWAKFHFGEGKDSVLLKGSDEIITLMPGLTIALLALVNIFLFADRKRQIRICTVLFIASIGAMVSAVFRITATSAELKANDFDYQFGMVWPVIAIIFTYMAKHSINKDEKLVRSADRLR
jgi:peptidoglycan/LPS O-acetylase OafA/YrhL